MSEIDWGEIDKANELFERHRVMIDRHLEGKGAWDGMLHNELVMQLQIAWPFAYAAAKVIEG